MEKVGRFVVRHRKAVLVFWFLVALTGVAMIGNITSRLSSTDNLPGLPSYAASQAILHVYGTGGDNPPDVMVLRLPPGPRVQSAAGRAELDAALVPLTGDKAYRVVSYANSGDDRLVSANGRTAVALVFGGNNEPTSYDLAARVRAAAPPGVSVAATSYYDLADGSQDQGRGVLAETVAGGIGALLVLAVVFGSLVALVPLVIAVLSILTTFLAIGVVTAVAPVSDLVEYLIALIGLGIAIDYSLLVVARWREERGHGLTNHEAVVAAVSAAGRTVAFSGITVGIGLLALVVLPIPFLQSLGYAGILIPLVSVVVAVTLLPALLATAGPRLEWPHRRKAASARPSRSWTAWARFVVRHRVISALAALVVLGALLGVAAGIRAGAPQPGSLSTSGPAASGLATLERDGFPVGIITPVEVMVPGGQDATGLARQLAAMPGAYTAVAPGGPAWRRAGTALVDVLPSAPTTAPSNTALIDAVHSRLAATDPRAGVTGFGPVEGDVVHALYERSPLILALVGLVTLLVLAFAFRSLVLPVKALLLNVLSVGATMGILVLVWQHGLGSGLIWGIPRTGAVVDFVPLMVFAFLFGLSMDYEVFIVSRIREAHEAGSTTDDSVVAGVAYTGRLVTSAALVLVLAFAALASGPQVSLKMFATGLAAGVLIDATVVRGLLLPAVVSLLGERSWWHPRRHPGPVVAVDRSPR
jgi:putative drug exporter of the RND superfamily